MPLSPGSPASIDSGQTVAMGASAAHAPELAHRALSSLDVLAQSLAAAGPSIALAGVPAIVYLSAGKGTLWSFAAATAIVLVIAYNVAQMATRTAAVGSLYTWIAGGLGRIPAFLGGWSMLIGGAGIAIACTAGTSLYAGAFLSELGLPGSSTAVQVALQVLTVAVAVWVPVRGVKLSTRVGLLLEGVSIAAILVLFVAVLVHHGPGIDRSQLVPHGLDGSGVVVGIVLAVTAFVGFESAASLGAEARDPHRAIPRSILLVVLVIGGLYVVGSYVEGIGFASVPDLAASSAPLNDLGDYAGIGWINPVLDLALAASSLACVSASVQSASRTLYSFGREHVLPSALGQVHPRTHTPWIATLTLVPVLVAVPVIMTVAHTPPLLIFSYVASVATFGFLLAYLLVSVATPVFLHRRGEPSVRSVIVAVFSLAAIGVVVYKNLVPAPEPPFNILPYVYLGLLVLGAVWYAALALRAPERAARVGTLRHSDVRDLEDAPSEASV